MEGALAALQPKLAQVLACIAKTVAEVTTILQEQEGDVSHASGAKNTFGDVQLQLDCTVDEHIFARLRECPACCAASSEEQPEMCALQGEGYTVVFDPLDGSSIVSADFSVGSIFGVWPGKGVVGRTGRQQAAAAYAVYGPRTMLVWARPEAGASGPVVVEQWVLSSKERVWKLLNSTRSHTLRAAAGSTADSNGHHAAPDSSSQAKGAVGIVAPSKPIFAPANLRCAAQNEAYKRLVDSWVQRGFTLRYTGGMVPDVHHILAKGGGVFVNPSSAAAPAKLRLVYECAPLAFIMEAAGGASHDGNTSILDVEVTSTAAKSQIVLGSSQLVSECLEAMRTKA